MGRSRCGGASSCAPFALFTSRSTSVRAPFSSQPAAISMRSADSMSNFLSAKKFISVWPCEKWAASKFCLNPLSPPAANCGCIPHAKFLGTHLLSSSEERAPPAPATNSIFGTTANAKTAARCSDCPSCAVMYDAIESTEISQNEKRKSVDRHLSRDQAPNHHQRPHHVSNARGARNGQQNAATSTFPRANRAHSQRPDEV